MAPKHTSTASHPPSQASTNASAARAVPPPAPAQQTHFERLILVDKHYSSKLHISKRYPSVRPLLIALEISGHGFPWISLVSAAFFVYPHPEVVLNLLTALILDLVVVGIIKAIVRRPRPSYNVNDMFGTVSVDRFSFPSGHTTRAAMVAAYLFFALTVNEQAAFAVQDAGSSSAPFSLCKSFLLGVSLYIDISMLAFLWAAMVAVSRVMLGRHHIGDVIVGFLVGIGQYYLVRYLLWISAEQAHAVRERLLAWLSTAVGGWGSQ